MKVVWVSRHELNEKNMNILKKAFGDGVEVIQYSDTVKDVRDLVEFAVVNNADAFVVVLPPHLIQQLLSVTKLPICRFVVEREVREDGEVEFTPIGLERIVRIVVETERIV